MNKEKKEKGKNKEGKKQPRVKMSDKKKEERKD